MFFAIKKTRDARKAKGLTMFMLVFARWTTNTLDSIQVFTSVAQDA